jgi:diguanylate cyclase (GGDEF)-like protein
MEASAPIFPIRIAAIGRERLRWRGSGAQLGQGADPATIARTFAYLFGFGAVLLLATLLLPGSVQRQDGALAVVAGVAFLVAAVLIAGYDRLPMWFLKLAPGLGTALVATVVGFAGPSASSAYAMYLAWVVIAAGCFFSVRLTLAHALGAIVAYAIAMKVTGYQGLFGLQLAMTAGTGAVAAGVMCGLVGQLREVMAKLESAARTDPLTGVLNRRALADEFERELIRARRVECTLGLVMLDLDHFKRYNDEWGHPEGDEALRRAATAIEHSTRGIDTVARLGGEEFAIIVPEADAAGALVLAERVRRAVELEFSGEQPRLTVSCGVAVFPADGLERGNLLAAADRALYEAKSLGRNCAVASRGGSEPAPQPVFSPRS